VSFLDHLLDAPIANILIIAGIAFLGIAAVGKITGKIEPDKSGRIISGLLGIVFLFGGAYKHASDDSSRGQNNTTQPDKTPHQVADVETGNALSGRWEFTEKSTVSGNTYRGVANLVVSGSQPWILTFDGRPPDVIVNSQFRVLKFMSSQWQQSHAP
jgi:hypothetical protein